MKMVSVCLFIFRFINEAIETLDMFWHPFLGKTLDLGSFEKFDK